MKSKKGSIIGIILARKGSKKIKCKNMAVLDDEPLILRALKVMRDSKCEFV